MQKILLYYKFTPIRDPEAIRLWQKSLCEKLNLKGRILVSRHGLNGTAGGEIDDLKSYIKETKQYSGFKGTVFKWSDGSRDDFPRLSVRNRRELVGFKNSDDEFDVDQNGVLDGGKHLKPEKLHQLIEEYGDDVVFFDGRNKLEAKIGKFKNAVVPDTRTSRDFIAELESNKYDDIKDKKVVAYCTGGIRCEVITAMMKKRGFKDVYQIDGGIVKYGEKYGDEGLWQGALRVFDNRKIMYFSDKAEDIGECVHCKNKTSNLENCALAECNEFVILCENCAKDYDKRYHSMECRKISDSKSQAHRPEPNSELVGA